jgi:hypothetical protein
MRFFFKVFRGEVPVDEPAYDSLQIALPRILVVEIIGVLPDIQREKAVNARAHRRGGIAGRLDGKPAAPGHQPDPAGTELALARLDQPGDQRVGAAEVARDEAGQASGWRTGFRRQAAPLEIVIPDLRRVVEDLLLLRVGRFGGRRHDLLQRHVGIGRARHQRVEGVDIGLVMLAVME